MPKLRTVRYLAIVAFLTGIPVVVALALLASTGENAAAGTPVPSVEAAVPALNSKDIQVLGLSHAVEIPSDSAGKVAMSDADAAAAVSIGVTTPRVTHSEAIAIAQNYVGRHNHPERVYLVVGTMPMAGHLNPKAWVVLFAGGDAPVAGPTNGRKTAPIAVTGVLVDAENGDVLEVFQR